MLLSIDYILVFKYVHYFRCTVNVIYLCLKLRGLKKDL